MGWTAPFKKITKQPKSTTHEEGIALFMVLGSLALLAMLVGDFLLTSKINQKAGYDQIDQVQSLYTLKSGYKLALLRLRAFKLIKAQTARLAAAVPGGIPPSLLNPIWNFPLEFPLPENLMALLPGERDAIAKFQKDSNIAGQMRLTIRTEMSRFFINGILPEMVRAARAPSPRATPQPSGSSPTPPGPPGSSPSPTPSPSPSLAPYTIQDADRTLTGWLETIIQERSAKDEDFQRTYRDLRVSDLSGQILEWMSPYAQQGRWPRDAGTSPKRAPLYSIDELHYIPLIDEELYNLIAPLFSTQMGTAININSMNGNTLRLLFPLIDSEEIDAFFEFRDSTDKDNNFKSQDQIFDYASREIAAYRNNSRALDEVKESIQKRGIRLVTEDTVFTLEIEATVHRTKRKLTATVVLDDRAPLPTQTTVMKSTQKPTGLRITDYRIE